MHRPQSAAESFVAAIRLRLDHIDALNNLGVAQLQMGEFVAAIESFDRLIAIKPDYVQAYCSRAYARVYCDSLDAALGDFERAKALGAPLPWVGYNKSLALLLGGRFSAGWASFEDRLHPGSGTGVEPRDLPQWRWRGRERLSGKRILLHAEYGFGDTIQFARFANVIAEHGARVILEVPQTLCALISTLRSEPQVIAREASLPPLLSFDYHCPLLSTPLALNTRLTSIPAARRYLDADFAKTSLWRERLQSYRAPRIGLAWSGNPAHGNDAHRSIALRTMLDELPAEFTYVSLQREVRPSDQLELERQGTRVAQFSNLLHDFSDTAALCDCLDLIISVDTSVAHLSGALGRPTWVLLPFNPDWRWMLGRDDSPWYPTVKLYRQQRAGEWRSVLGRVSEHLRQTAL